MISRNTTQSLSSTNENTSVPEPSPSHGRSRGGKGVTQARARAQRTKLDVQAYEKQELAHSPAEEKHQTGHSKNRKNVTIERAIQDYIDDHEGGNHSDKTIEWHQTALGLLQTYLQHEREITLITGIDAPDISAWFASMRKTPGARGKIRSERTIQTYCQGRWNSEPILNWPPR